MKQEKHMDNWKINLKIWYNDIIWWKWVLNIYEKFEFLECYFSNNDGVFLEYNCEYISKFVLFFEK